MIFHQTQKIVAIDKHRFRVVNCGRRWGKTELAVQEMAGKSFSKHGMVIAYIAPFYQQARDIAWGRLKEVCRPIAISINESRLEIKVQTQDEGTSTIMLRGWESIDSLRGQSFDFLVLDEVASMKRFFNYWQEVLRPTLTDRKGHALFISTPRGFNHFYDLYNLEEDDDDFRSFKFTTYENPHIDPMEVDKAKKELTENRFAQEYLADFKKHEGLIYKEFDRKIHVIKEIPSAHFVDTFAGVDFGFTNPSSIMVIKQTSDNVFYVTNEYYKTGKVNIELIEIAKNWRDEYGIHSFYPDPAEPDRIEEWKRHGLHCKEVSKHPKSLMAGIDRIRTLLRENRLFIHTSCANLIWEFENYRFKEIKNKDNIETPEKEDDHALDGVRYAIYMKTNKREQRTVTKVHAYRPG